MRIGRKTETVECEHCKRSFQKESYEIRRTNHNLCSAECRQAMSRKVVEARCAECNGVVIRQPAQRRSRLAFCNHSCHATYYNRIRQKTRRSKAEAALFNYLTSAFPDLIIIPNNKDIIPGVEVDIAIPELRLAIEWNGIVHLQPIYGEDKLKAIQRRDAMKSSMANDLGLRLVTIHDADSSQRTIDTACSEIHKIVSSLLQSGGG